MVRSLTVQLLPVVLLCIAFATKCSQPQTVCDEVAETIPADVALDVELSADNRAVLAERFDNRPALEEEENELFRSERRNWEIKMITDKHATEMAALTAIVGGIDGLPAGAKSDLHRASLHAHEHVYVMGLAVIERQLRAGDFAISQGDQTAFEDSLAAVCELHRR